MDEQVLKDLRHDMINELYNQGARMDIIQGAVAFLETEEHMRKMLDWLEETKDIPVSNSEVALKIQEIYHEQD